MNTRWNKLKAQLFVHHGNITALAAAVCGVLFGIGFRFWIYQRAFYVPRDSIEYFEQARALITHPEYINQFSRPPLFQWAWSRLLILGFSDFVAASILTMTCGCALLLFVYPLCRELKLGRTAAVLTVWLAAVNPWLVKMSILPLRESMYLGSAILVLYMLLRSLRPGMFCITQSVGAVFFVLCAMSRVEGIQLLLPWAWQIAVRWKTMRTPPRDWLKDVVIFPAVSVFSLVIICAIMNYELRRLFDVLFKLTIQR